MNEIKIKAAGKCSLVNEELMSSYTEKYILTWKIKYIDNAPKTKLPTIKSKYCERWGKVQVKEGKLGLARIDNFFFLKGIYAQTFLRALLCGSDKKKTLFHITVYLQSWTICVGFVSLFEFCLVLNNYIVCCGIYTAKKIILLHGKQKSATTYSGCHKRRITYHAFIEQLTSRDICAKSKVTGVFFRVKS